MTNKQTHKHIKETIERAQSVVLQVKNHRTRSGNIIPQTHRLRRELSDALALLSHGLPLKVEILCTMYYWFGQFDAHTTLDVRQSDLDLIHSTLDALWEAYQAKHDLGKYAEFS